MGTQFARALDELLVPPFSQQYLCNALDCDRSNVFRYCSGERLPTPRRLRAMARALATSAEPEPDRTFQDVYHKLLSAWWLDAHERR
jgi:transcriptional regulator with XRE-family HTH domain